MAVSKYLGNFWLFRLQHYWVKTLLNLLEQTIILKSAICHSLTLYWLSSDDVYLQSSDSQQFFIYEVQDFEGCKHSREEDVILGGLGKGAEDIIRNDRAKQEKRQTNLKMKNNFCNHTKI